jgi:transposase-like protein
MLNQKRENVMERPDLDTLACVNAECQLFRQNGQGNLVVRKVYGREAIRLLRCRRCCEEFSERRGTALFNTKVSESTAVDVIEHLGEGCSVRSTARLTKVCKDTVARLWRMSGRHAERVHDQHVQGLTPRALELDEQWGSVKKSKNGVGLMSEMRPVINGITPPWPLTASWWCR